MSEQTLEDLFARLERERQDADRVYNDALTALDRAIQTPPVLPDAPGLLHELQPRLAGLASPAGGGPIAGVRALLWRVLGPPPMPFAQRFQDALAEQSASNATAHRELRQTVGALLDTLRNQFNALTQFESLLIQYLQTITLYVDTRDRRLGAGDLRDRLTLIDQRVMALKRELEQRTTSATEGAAREAFVGNVDSSTYVGFEDRFRGSRDAIRHRVEEYLPLLQTASDVVDIGCGRGELLDLLRERGVRARGADVNQAMVELCRERGLEVEHADALSFLARQPDGSIGGLAAIQVVEHFEPGYLARFLEAAYHRMRPGSPLILETINPACWMAFFETYIRDLTHQRPLHPDTLRYLVEASGFTAVDVQFRQPVTESDRLDRVPVRTPPPDDRGAPGDALAQIVAALNAHADKLNARLFSTMDYVVVARR